MFPNTYSWVFLWVRMLLEKYFSFPPPLSPFLVKVSENKSSANYRAQWAYNAQEQLNFPFFAFIVWTKGCLMTKILTTVNKKCEGIYA